MYEVIEATFRNTIHYGILAVEIVGVIILLITAIKAVFQVFKDHGEARHMLADGITTALSFLLASEVMKTIVAPDWKDIGMTCAILLMRAAMTVLIHWEEKSSHEGHGG